MSNLIYLDYAATTPIDPRVLVAMSPYFSEAFGNPSSIHRYGQEAEAAVETARETVAAVLNCSPDEIVFTSCGSESDNLALRGAAQARRFASGADRILTSRAEHHAVSKTAEQLQAYYGFQAGWLECDKFGVVHPQAVERHLRQETAREASVALVSVMYANNEIGSINPIPQIAATCRASGVLLHTDAVQAAAYLPIDVQALGVDLLSLGGHKFYGPKGVGALYVRKGVSILPTQTGGGQESGLRAGTQNVPYIVGFAEALRLAADERDQRIGHVLPLRDRLIGAVLEEIPDSRLTGHPQLRLPNHASFAFRDVDGNLLLTLLDAAGFACSSGSACKTGNPEPSEVMTAIGLPREWGLGSLRLTLGSGSTVAQVDQLLRALPPLVEKARKLTREAQQESPPAQGDGVLDDRD
jgi:cysteine desulfurase